MTMTSITRSQRAAIKRHLDATDYDVGTIRIDAAGNVTALKDADKTYNGPETMRYLVGHADDILRDAGR